MVAKGKVKVRFQLVAYRERGKKAALICYDDCGRNDVVSFGTCKFFKSLMKKLKI